MRRRLAIRVTGIVIVLAVACAGCSAVVHSGGAKVPPHTAPPARGAKAIVTVTDPASVTPKTRSATSPTPAPSPAIGASAGGTRHRHAGPGDR